ncbi:MAG: hypothetical protein JSW64_01170 [Candidatus Zixiibacteriota bacterium]|nr:MAG: hypothetical protein JSW64_01170 [candidate division Zixibacteria bacterium]
MRKIYYPKTFFTAIIFLLVAITAFAQWPVSSDSNMIICDRFGDQCIPKIAAASDGGCYVSWFDHSSGNYDVYMQRLNGNGVIQWDSGGMLISNETQETWLTDYDMTVDGDDHAIVVFNDTRAGGDWDIYAYRISPNGDFIWGTSGLTLSDNVNFEANAVVTVTSSGNFVFAWQDEISVYLRKVDPQGTDMWSPHTINITSTYGTVKPRIVSAESDDVIVAVMQASGPNYWDPQHLYAHKFDSLGVEQWGSGGVAISTAGGIAPYMDYDLTSDGDGGAYSFWYDDRDMSLNAYVQHILSDGAMAWTANGVQVSLAAGELQMYPSLVRFSSSSEVLVFYLATDINQNLNGVHGQKLDSLGTRQWGSNGIVFVPMTNQTRSHISAQPQPEGAVIVYKEYPPGSAIQSYIKATRVDMDGNQVWSTSPVDMCSNLSEKIRVPTTVNDSGMVIAAWDDGRLDPNGDIYLQNINADGSLGPPSGSSGCEYVVGDVNNSGAYNGLDITYGVAFFKGGAAPPYQCECTPGNFWYVAGDVNNSCSFNGLDITYGVAYFKGGADPIPCDDCPPVE